eukprot:SAG31_NODE_642_length_13301_cov_14.143084_2_plen_265_part_00
MGTVQTFQRTPMASHPGLPAPAALLLLLLLLLLRPADLTAMAAAPPQATSPPPPLAVSVAPNGSYSVLVDGVQWLQGGDTFVTAANQIFSLAGGTLTLAEPLEHTAGRDGLGNFLRTALHLRTVPQSNTSIEVEVVFSIKHYEDGETVEFVQEFPSGLPQSEALGVFGVAAANYSCTTVPKPCPRTEGRFYCNSSVAKGQCDKPTHPTPCPPCPPPPVPLPGNPNAVGTAFPAWQQSSSEHALPARGWMAYDGWDCEFLEFYNA